MATVINASSRDGARALHRLRDDIVAWLVTVSQAGAPQASVVWFLWMEDEVVVYSRPGKPKVRNIEHHRAVGLVLNSDDQGNDMVTVEGTARIDLDFTPADRLGPYVEKYRQAISGLGMTPESFAAAYSVPILVTPERARYW